MKFAALEQSMAGVSQETAGIPNELPELSLNAPNLAGWLVGRFAQTLLCPVKSEAQSRHEIGVRRNLTRFFGDLCFATADAKAGLGDYRLRERQPRRLRAAEQEAAEARSSPSQ